MRTLGVFLFLSLFSFSYAESYLLNVNADLSCYRRVMGPETMEVFIYSQNRGLIAEVKELDLDHVMIRNFRWQHQNDEDRVLVKVKSRGMFDKVRFSGQCVVSVRGDGLSMADAECMGTKGLRDTDCLRGMTLHLQKVVN